MNSFGSALKLDIITSVSNTVLYFPFSLLFFLQKARGKLKNTVKGPVPHVGFPESSFDKFAEGFSKLGYKVKFLSLFWYF